MWWAEDPVHSSIGENFGEVRLREESRRRDSSGIDD